MTRRQRIQMAVGIALLGVVVAAFILVGHRGMPLMSKDSTSYIEWHSGRTPGYPLFLRLVAVLDPSYRIVPPLQFAIFIAATVLFCDAFASLLRSRIAGFLIGVAVFGNLSLMRYPSTLLTDGPFLALLLCHVACVLYSARDPRLRWPVLAGLALGIVILIRPVGYVVFFVLPWLLLLWQGQARVAIRAVLLCIIPVAMILLACTGDYFARGYFATQSGGNYFLIRQVALFAAPQVSGFDPAAARAYEALQPLRDSEAAAGGWDSRILISSLVYDFTTPILVPAREIVDAEPERWRTASPYWRDIALDTLWGRYAHAVIAADPRAYAEQFVQRLYGLWFLPHLARHATAETVTKVLVTHAGWEPAYVATQLKPIPGWAWVGKLILFGALFLASIWAIVASLWRRDPILRGLAYLALLTNCYFGVVALLEMVLPRYSMMAWPFQCAILVGLILYYLRSTPNGNSSPDTPAV